MLDTFYKLREVQGDNRIFFFIAKMYDNNLLNSSKANLFSQIESIFDSNIQDKGIMEEFGFKFITDITFDIVVGNKPITF